MPEEREESIKPESEENPYESEEEKFSDGDPYNNDDQDDNLYGAYDN